jgi:hypothetical protein
MKMFYCINFQAETIGRLRKERDPDLEREGKFTNADQSFQN